MNEYYEEEDLAAFANIDGAHAKAKSPGYSERRLSSVIWFVIWSPRFEWHKGRPDNRARR